MCARRCCASYKRTSHAVDITALTNVLDIDVERMVVTAEGGVTMGVLAAATLRRRAVPRVTPEFATFSVSGLGTTASATRRSPAWRHRVPLN